MGTTHVSKMVLLEMGFSFPWKVPIAPKAKKALLALFIALSMALVAEIPKMPMGDVDTGLDVDTVRISHLAGLSTSALSSAKVCTTLICCCRVTRELVTVRMSSA